MISHLKLPLNSLPLLITTASSFFNLMHPALLRLTGVFQHAVRVAETDTVAKPAVPMGILHQQLVPPFLHPGGAEKRISNQVAPGVEVVNPLVVDPDLQGVV